MVERRGLLGKMGLSDPQGNVAHLVQQDLKDHPVNQELLVHLDLEVK